MNGVRAEEVQRRLNAMMKSFPSLADLGYVGRSAAVQPLLGVRDKIGRWRWLTGGRRAELTLLLLAANDEIAKLEDEIARLESERKP